MVKYNDHLQQNNVDNIQSTNTQITYHSHSTHQPTRADANILKPAEKTDEIGAGATLSVALPLCLTALIVMFK